MITRLPGARFLLPLLFGSCLAANALGDDLRVEVMTEGLNHPWSLAFLPDGRWLVTERAGSLRLVAADDRSQTRQVDGLPAMVTGGQGGLLEVMLDQDFASNRQLYLSYSCGSRSANHTCLSRARLDGEQLTDVHELFRSQPAKNGMAHFGGRMLQLSDGSLMLTLGDGFDYREQAQQLDSHLGSIVRLRSDGSVPPDNPFARADDDTLPEIYSYGHRNVQGIVWHAASNRIIAHEHGPRGGDEINHIRAGENYGWPLATHGVDYTGAKITPYTSYPGTIDPMLDWTPSIAPAGMAVYRGEMFPEWQDDLLVTALAGQALHRVRLSEDGAETKDILLRDRNQRLRDVRVASDGSILLLTDSRNGQILRLSRP